MSVEQRKIVDFASIRRATGRTVLTIADHLPWLPDNGHLLTLQAKLNDYLAFIESGEIYDSYPESRGREIEIQVVCKHPPAGDAIRFFELAGETVRRAGFHFSTKIFEGSSRGEG